MKAPWGVHAWEGRGLSPSVRNAGRSPYRTAVGRPVLSHAQRDEGRVGLQAEVTFRSSLNA